MPRPASTRCRAEPISDRARPPSLARTAPPEGGAPVAVTRSILPLTRCAQRPGGSPAGARRPWSRSPDRRAARRRAPERCASSSSEKASSSSSTGGAGDGGRPGRWPRAAGRARRSAGDPGRAGCGHRARRRRSRARRGAGRPSSSHDGVLAARPGECVGERPAARRARSASSSAPVVAGQHARTPRPRMARGRPRAASARRRAARRLVTSCRPRRRGSWRLRCRDARRAGASRAFRCRSTRRGAARSTPSAGVRLRRAPRRGSRGAPLGAALDEHEVVRREHRCPQHLEQLRGARAPVGRLWLDPVAPARDDVHLDLDASRLPVHDSQRTSPLRRPCAHHGLAGRPAERLQRRGSTRSPRAGSSCRRRSRPCTTVSPSGAGWNSIAAKLRKSRSSSRADRPSRPYGFEAGSGHLHRHEQVAVVVLAVPAHQSPACPGRSPRARACPTHRFDPVEQVVRVEGHRQVLALEIAFDALVGTAALRR